MAVMGQSKILELSQAKGDPKRALIEAVGDISGVTVCGNSILVATYIRPEKTVGGVILPEGVLNEDEFQGNVGLVLKMGESFGEDEGKATLHHWVLYGYNDGLRLRYNRVPCKILPIERVRAFDIDPTKVL